ncbi:MAG: GTPase [Planctomycetota bacterium]
MLSGTDTIVAVSSPPGRSARGLIRLSGEAAFDILTQLIDSPVPPPRQITPTRLRYPSLPILTAVFPGPHSYTGQDIAELQLPGHPALLERVVIAALVCGVNPSGGGRARLAEAGEFTFRAYTAGRLDLTRAEGIAATIHAVSDGQLAAAAHLRDGELARFAAEHVETLGRLLALVEAGIDFVDQEDVVPITPRVLADKLSEQQAALAGLLGRSRSWGTVEALPRVVLVGPPSAGKSTLFNALLDRPRAVIDAAPGTTRDVLEEPLLLPHAQAPSGGNEIMLVDLAGLDAAGGRLERDIQDRARRAIGQADLVLLAGPPGTTFPSVPRAAATLRVVTKSDLPTDEEIGPEPDAVRVSAAMGVGLDPLRVAIAQRLGDRAVSVRAELLTLQPRHESALRGAADRLDEAQTWIDPEAHALGEIELVAGALRVALDDLAGLGGELTPDDVIGKVFSTFCVGK